MKNNKLKIVIQLALFLVVKGASAQQTVHRANEFNFGQSGSGFSINADDFIARDKISLIPECDASPFSNTHTNLSIDKTLQNPVTYQATSTALVPYPQACTIDLPINKTLPVGSFSGVAGVSSTGSATYHFSIYTPPGTNNLLPQIGFSYNSSSIEGILGRGWDLNGISAITRVPKTIYHNGKMEGILLDGTDKLSLDGNRLIESPSNGVNTFRPERENFNLITSINNNEYFIVETKDGLKKYYGTIDDNQNSRLVLEDGSHNPQTLTWYLSRIEDKFGNYILYKYNNSQGEITLQEIAYTGNSASNITPYNFIRFYYDKRLDENTLYLLGNPIKRTLLIREIEVFCEEKSMKRYKFNYVFNVQSFLREITEYGTDNSQLNSTLFKYGEGSEMEKNVRQELNPDPNGSINDPLFTPGPIDIENSIVGDFNGDGKIDQVQLTPLQPVGIPTNLHWDLWLNTSGVLVESSATDSNYPASDVINNFKQFVPSSYFTQDTTQIDGNTLLPGTTTVIGNSRSPVNYAQALDVNADGLDDIVFVTTDVFGFTEVTPYFSNGNGFKKGDTWDVRISDALLFGDINGDATPEIILYYHDNNGIDNHFMVFNFANVNAPAINSTTHTTINNGNPVYHDFKLIDFDGDGKTELIASTSEGGSVVLKLDFNGIVLNVSEIFYTPKYLFGWETVFGDFNGDGLIDLFNYRGIVNSLSGAGVGNYYINSKKYDIEYNTSKGFVNEQNAITRVVSNSDYKENFIAFDYNNDGADDIIAIRDNSVDRIYFDLYYNGKGQKISLGYTPRAGTKNNNDVLTSLTFGNLPGLVTIDFDGDGFKDILYKEKGLNFGFVNSLIQFNKGTSFNLLKEVSDGFRNKTKFNYSTLVSEVNGFYEKGNDAQFPLIDISPATFALQAIITHDGTGGENITSYKYKGLKNHLNGLGLIGFKSQSNFNSKNKLLKVVDYDINSTYFVRVEKSNKSYKINGSTPLLLYEKTLTPNFIDLGNLRFMYLYIHEESFDHLTNYPVTIDFVYDQGNNGILTEKHTNVNNNLQVTHEFYTPLIGNCGSWMQSKIESSTITAIRNGSAAYTRTTNFEYNPTNGNVIKLISEKNNNLYETSTEIEYWSTGQVKQTTTTGVGGVQAIINSLEYDSKFRFAIKTTNTLNQVAETKYDPRWGVPIWQKGIDNNISEAYYDGYGNVIKTISPDNTVSKSTTAWVQSSEISNLHPFGVSNKGLISVENKSSGNPTSKSYFDSFGREILSFTEGFNKTVYAAKEFDQKGNVINSTGTYDADMLSASSTYKSVLNSYIYDDFNRLLSVSADDGVIDPLTTNYVYDYPGNGMLKTTITAPDGKHTIKIDDATGLLESVEDNIGSIINYTYHSSGQVATTLISGEGIQTTATYNAIGKLASFAEKNSLPITYTTDAYGRVITQLQDNKTYNFTYNQFGQLSTKAGPEGIYNYQYNTSGFGINQPSSITGPNAYNTIEYEYDKLNRPIIKKESVNGSPKYKIEYTYDENNHLKKLTYPNNFAVEYSYDAKGFATHINRSDNGALIWKADEINHMGQITKYTLGNNPQSENTYTNFGLPIELKTAGIQDLFYSFNPENGNMMQRKDIMRNLQEDFTYTDGLDRLNSAQVLGQNLNEINYLPNGNIGNKTQIGSYSYSNAKPNAVVSVENTDNLISEFNQDITYTAFNKAQQIIEGNYKLDYAYGAFEERKTSVLTNTVNNSVVCERLYLDAFEKTIQNGNIYEVTYINAPTGLAAIFVKENGNSGKMHYVYADNLGSLTTLIDDAGNKTEQSFDAWGNKRNPADWTTSNIPTVPDWLYRGYTGHELLNDFALINMNGRMYDPLLGRMLSPDKFLQDPTNTQNYNRYSYTLNNPLKYTDPSGWQNIPRGGGNSISFYNWIDGESGDAVGGRTGGVGQHVDASKENSASIDFEYQGLSEFQLSYTLYAEGVMDGTIDPTNTLPGRNPDTGKRGYFVGCGCATGESTAVRDDNGNLIKVNTKTYEVQTFVEFDLHNTQSSEINNDAGAALSAALLIGLSGPQAAVTAGLVAAIYLYIQYFPAPVLDMSQHGKNDGRLEHDEREAIRERIEKGTASSKDILKWKKDQKNLRDRPSRQTKDRK